MSAEQELIVGNSRYGKNNLYLNYTWVSDRALMDYVLLNKRMRRRWIDVNVCRGDGGGMSGHFLVKTRLKVTGGWRSAGRMEGKGKVFYGPEPSSGNNTPVCTSHVTFPRNVLKINELIKSVNKTGIPGELARKT